MKTNLSYILPVPEACAILGEATVRRVVRSLYVLRHPQQKDNIEQDVNLLVKAMMYVPPSPPNKPTSTSTPNTTLPNPSTTTTAAGATPVATSGTHVGSIPPGVAQAQGRLWKRNMALDKHSLFRFWIPSCTQPHGGANGHMGLFDCLVYALAGRQTSSTAAAMPNTSLVYLPDLIIAMAICKAYQNQQSLSSYQQTHHHHKHHQQHQPQQPQQQQQQQQSSSSSEDAPASTGSTWNPSTKRVLWIMAAWAFRIYDSYQKRGAVSRDTVHRFLSDVHGEEFYKTPPIKVLLDAMFAPVTEEDHQALQRNNNPNTITAVQLSSNVFAHRIFETATYSLLGSDAEHDHEKQENKKKEIYNVSHKLLDWIATLVGAMIPLENTPPSVVMYWELMDSNHRNLPKLCASFRLHESRLYEIKRRFHSLVESSSPIIQGDPMANENSGSANTTMTNQGSSAAVAGTGKHQISLSAFVQATSQPNEEMGHGGYLPVSLAKRVYWAGCCPPEDGSEYHHHPSGDPNDATATSNRGWALYDILQFGFHAVRLPMAKDDSDKIDDIIPPLVRFAFDVFHDYKDYNHYLPELPTNNSKTIKKEIMNRRELGRMLLLLLQHAHFRVSADSPPRDDGPDVEDAMDILLQQEIHTNNEIPESTLVDVHAASLLGLLPPNMERSAVTNVPSPRNNGKKPSSPSSSSVTAMVPLSLLVDYVLQEAGANGEEKTKTTSTTAKQGLTVEDLAYWHLHSSTSCLPPPQRRLGPFLLELQLVAAVLFGIPPSRASLEVEVHDELQRRHKFRYPRTEVSRRGPRGTIWYIIDDKWYRQWMAHVEQVGGTLEHDAADGRDKPTTNETPPRRLGRISNTGLLLDHGSLALRPDIKWRNDYDILPPQVWSAFQAWYDGGPPIHRTVVPYVGAGSNNPHSTRMPRLRTEHEMELYPFFVTVFLCDAASRGEARPFQQYVPVSRVSPVRVVLVQLCKSLDVEPRRGRLWMMAVSDNSGVAGAPGSSLGPRRPSSSSSSSTLLMMDTDSIASLTSTSAGSVAAPSDWLLDLDKNIVEQGRVGVIPDTIRLLLELKDEETGLWPRGVDGKQWTFREKSASSQPQSNTGDGVVGLYNMGNTCYLNSSIQCLSHTPIFRDYFTSKVYLHDINTTNPLGHQGRLAQVSAVLVNNLWKPFAQSATIGTQPKKITAPGSYAPVSAPALTPKTFKDSLGKFNDHFAGNEQHDAQELLAFLLGGLSEDLNRIVDKPYIEAPDSDGRPDSELADIWWSNHLKREMSIIVALFTGQYKSLLTCRSCKYESARFEPFSFLQLPLPEDDHVLVSLILYSRQPDTDTMRYSVRVRNDGTLWDILWELARVLHADEMERVKQQNQQGGADEGDAQEQEDADDDVGNDDDEEKKQQELDEVYNRMAQNMAVVDMRDGYIFKIAPNSWALPDLQNKETGELPTFHVYELDPLPDANMSLASSGGSNLRSDEFASNQGNMEEDVSAIEEAAVGVSALHTNANESNEAKEENGEDEPPQAQDEDDEEAGKEDAEGEAVANPEANPEEAEEEEAPTERSASSIKYSFLAFSQRRAEVVSRDFLHPTTHRVFGTPLLMRVVDLEGYSGRDLYDLVAERLRNFVPNGALRFLTDSPDGDYDEEDVNGKENENEDYGEPDTSATIGEEKKADGLPRLGSRQRLRQTMTDMEEVSAGPIPRYGFRLRVTCRDGRRCALCAWYESCIGCLVPDDDYPTIVVCGDSISIDWHYAVDVATNGFGLNHDASLASSASSMASGGLRSSRLAIKNHSSCSGAKKKGYVGAITLEDCLDSFAKEERIPEAYCSKCQDFRVQTKRMSLWRLPPIVIIQLKRFQFTQHMRRKLRDLVVFPIEGLDLSRIVASEDSIPITDIHMNRSSPPPNAHKNNGEEANGGDGDDENDENVDDMDKDRDNGEDALNDSGRSVMLYDLYGVVHHQGALSGGHYVASLKSELDGQWRLFNDAQIYDIHSRDVVDASAYILFYIRRDVQHKKLSDFWITREGQGLTEEEMDKLIRGRSDRCVIS